jgi:hypothetical protein
VLSPEQFDSASVGPKTAVLIFGVGAPKKCIASVSILNFAA